jgi:F0F1-type ATP synthase assembly protein I
MTRPKGSPGRGLAYLGAGFTFAAIVGGLAWAGSWLDRRCGTAPWLLIGGSLCGVALAVYDLLKTVARLERNETPRDGSS